MVYTTYAVGKGWELVMAFATIPKNEIHVFGI